MEFISNWFSEIASAGVVTFLLGPFIVKFGKIRSKAIRLYDSYKDAYKDGRLSSEEKDSIIRHTSELLEEIEKSGVIKILIGLVLKFKKKK